MGTRFILANTEQLHGKIQEMSDRIRSLEEALQSLHAEHTANPDDPHPLMRPSLLGIKSTMGLYSGQGPTSDSASKATSSSHHAMDVDSMKVERGSSEDTLTTPDTHGARAQVRI